MNLDKNFKINYLRNTGNIRIFSFNEIVHLTLTGKNGVFNFGNNNPSVSLKSTNSPLGKNGEEFSGTFQYQNLPYTITMITLLNGGGVASFLLARLLYNSKTIEQDDEEVFGAEASP